MGSSFGVKKIANRSRAFPGLRTAKLVSNDYMEIAIEDEPRVPSEAKPGLFNRDPGGGRGSEAGRQANFGGLVLGCIEASDSESRRIFHDFSRSTRQDFHPFAPL